MDTITRDWDWWAYLFRVKHRQQIPGIDILDNELIKLIVDVLRLEPGQRVLDLGCGSGVHTLRLARQSIECVGLDISPSLVAYDKRQAELAGAQNARYIVGDMRRPPLGQAFDAAIILSASFGFFDEAGNRAVLAGIYRALRPGGRVLLDLPDLAHFMDLRRKSWENLEGGFILFEEWYDPVICTRYISFRYLDSDGVMNMADEPEHLRVYSLIELKALLAQAGLEYTAAYGSPLPPAIAYSADYRRRMIVVARRSS